MTPWRTSFRGPDGEGTAADRTLLEGVGTAACIVGLEDSAERAAAFPVVAANARFSELLGLAPEDPSRLALAERVETEQRDGLRRACARAPHEPVPPCEIALRRPDGTLVWALCAVIGLRDRKRPGALLCLLTDITDRKRQEARLRQSEDRYRVLAESTQDQIFVIDRDDRVEFVNRAAAAQLNTVPDRLIGRLRAEIFPPAVVERQGHSLARVFDTGQPLHIEGPTRYAAGEVWLATSLAPLFDRDGSVRAVLGFSRDISERRAAEERLRSAEQRLRVVLASAPLILWASDREGRFTFCAGRGLGTMGLTPESVVGRGTADLHADGAAALGEHVARALTGETFSEQVDWQGATFEERYAPLMSETGEITGVIGVAVDVTERRKLEEQLSKSQRMDAIGRLAGGIAHDFNNNLTAILGFAELILSQIGDDKPISGDLREMQRAANRAADLVRRLLAFGRRQVFQPQPIDVNEVVASLRGMLERLIGERIQVVAALEPGLPLVSGDAGQLEQVVMNLVINARDAMPEGGVLSLETADVHVGADDALAASVPLGRYVVLSVRDTGVGMDAATRAQLFEPFFTTKPTGEGTGLGLSTVYGIVRQFDGFVVVDSRLGDGSTFRVLLPAMAQGSVPANLPVRSASRGAVVGRETILLVEDEETVRRFAKVALERHGFRVLAAASAQEALALVNAGGEHIDLVLTDVVMPGGSGPAFAEQLRRARPNVAVLYMSGYPAGMVQDGALDPSVRLLTKPFTTADLLTSVRELLTPR